MLWGTPTARDSVSTAHGTTRRTLLKASAMAVAVAGSALLAACGAGAGGSAAGARTNAAGSTSGATVAGGTTSSAATSSAAATPPPASNGATAASATIHYQYWDPAQTPLIAKQIALYQQTHPQDRVSADLVGDYTDYWAKLPVAIAGNSGPDLYWMTRPNFDIWSRKNLTTPVDGLVAKSAGAQAALKAMAPQYVATYQYQGKQRGIPISYDTMAVAYNADLFQAAGLTLPAVQEKTWTWDDLATAAKALTTSAAGASKQFGFSVSGDGHGMWWNLVWSNGGALFNADGTTSLLDQPAAVEAVQWMVDRQLKDQVAPTADDLKAQDAYHMFVAGRLAMLYVGSWQLTTLAKNVKSFTWDVAEFPLAPATRRRADASNVLGYIVNPASKQQDATFGLIEALVSREAQQLEAAMGIQAPARNDAAAPFYDPKLGPTNRQAFMRAAAYAHPMAFSQWVSYQDIIADSGKAFGPILAGQVAAQDGLTTLAQQLDAVAKREQANA